MIGSLIRQKAAVQANRRELFESLLRSTSRHAYSLAYRLTGSAADAEDLVQETYVRAYRFFHRYDESLPFMNWLCRIMSNTHIDLVRRKGKIKATSLEQPTVNGLSTVEVADEESTPDRALLDSSMSEPIQVGLDQMTPAFREAVILADVEGMAYEEIADIMNTSVGTVRSRIHRGRKQLRSYLVGNFPSQFGGQCDEL